MNHEDRPSTHYRIPISGNIIGILVSLLGIRGPILTEKTAQRYLSGIRVSPRSESLIITELAKLVLERGLLPPLSETDQPDLNWEKILYRAISSYCRDWDSLVAYLWRTSAPISGNEKVLEWVLHLMVVDVAFRIATGLLILGEEPPDETVPSWAKADSRGHCMRQIQAELNANRPSLEKLAEQAEVSPNALDEWLAGRSRPYDRNIAALASALANYHSFGNATEIAGRLRRHYFLSDLCTLISESIGHETVEAMAATLMRLAHRVMALLQTGESQTSATRLLELAILMEGSRNVLATELVKVLADEESDREWREAILSSASEVGWITYIQDKAYRVAAHIGDLNPLEHDGNSPPDFREYEHRFIQRTTAMRHFAAQGEFLAMDKYFSEDIADLRACIKMNPESTEYHYALGVRLGHHGVLTGDSNCVEEGILECRLASQLDPEWDVPILEVGIIRMKQGRFQEAQQELEAGIARFGAATPGLLFNLAEASMHCGDFGRAIPLFEQVIDAVPDFAEAIDFLAFCCIRYGDRQRGRNLAQKARHLGSSWTFDRLEAGHL